MFGDACWPEDDRTIELDTGCEDSTAELAATDDGA